MSKYVDFNTLSKWGLIIKINHDILHPLGLALSYDKESGKSNGCIVAEDLFWEYPKNTINEGKERFELFVKDRFDLLHNFNKDDEIIEEILPQKPERTESSSFRLGLVGYSTQDFDKALAEIYLKEVFDKIYAEHQSNVILVSGLTDMGIPKIGYTLARKYGWKLQGIAPECSKEYTPFNVDFSTFVGDNWGDESVYFLDHIDALVRIGGGKQSIKETLWAKAKSLKVYEYDLPPIVIPNLEDSYIEDFYNRTNQHIKYVKEFGYKLLKLFPDLEKTSFVDDIEVHDKSKFSLAEEEGYKWINAHYNFDLPYPNKEIENLAENAWTHHKMLNDHHPEFYKDINEMKIENIAHMVSDWKAMEFSASKPMKCKEFYEKIGSKKYYDFDEIHRRWILQFIDALVGDE